MTDIVLVHSNEKILDIYASKLKPHFRTHLAMDGISGVRTIRRTNPSLVVAEYELPWLSGMGILKFVRKHPELKVVPVIIVSREAPVNEAMVSGLNE